MKAAPTVKRLRETTPVGVIIHADCANGDDRTLCGMAEEGACMRDAEDTTFEEVDRGKINCEDCLAIIRHCKGIPARVLAKRLAA